MSNETAVAAGVGVKLAPKVRAGKHTAEYLDPDGNVVPLRAKQPVDRPLRHPNLRFLNRFTRAAGDLVLAT